METTNEFLILFFVISAILFLPVLSIAVFASRAKRSNDKLNEECKCPKKH